MLWKLWVYRVLPARLARAKDSVHVHFGLFVGRCRCPALELEGWCERSLSKHVARPVRRLYPPVRGGYGYYGPEEADTCRQPWTGLLTSAGRGTTHNPFQESFHTFGAAVRWSCSVSVTRRGGGCAPSQRAAASISRDSRLPSQTPQQSLCRLLRMDTIRNSEIVPVRHGLGLCTARLLPMFPRRRTFSSALVIPAVLPVTGVTYCV